MGYYKNKLYSGQRYSPRMNEFPIKINSQNFKEVKILSNNLDVIATLGGVAKFNVKLYLLHDLTSAIREDAVPHTGSKEAGKVIGGKHPLVTGHS